MGRPRKLSESPLVLKEPVIAAYVEDAELAELYKMMLLESSIPVQVEKVQSNDTTRFYDTALIVPKEFLDQAYDLLVRQAVCDDFFDELVDSDSSYVEDTDSDEV